MILFNNCVKRPQDEFINDVMSSNYVMIERGPSWSRVNGTTTAPMD